MPRPRPRKAAAPPLEKADTPRRQAGSLREIRFEVDTFKTLDKETPASDSALEIDSAPKDLFPDPNNSPASSDPIGLYLKEMARVPLLTGKEETELALSIEKGRRARLKIVQLKGRSAAPQRRRLQAVIQAGERARERLIKSNTRLVVSIARRYLGRGIAFLDLIQEGNLGLIKAVEKYDYKRGFRFSTYATWWIRQTISRAVTDQARTIRVPAHMAEQIRRLYKAQNQLEQEIGRRPTLEELAKKSGMSVSQTQWALRVAQTPVSLESPLSEDDDAEIGQFLADDITPSPAQSAYESMLKERLEEALESLPAREAQVLRLRFGLKDGREYTLKEIGDKFGLTRERIRQIEINALKQLRSPRKTRDLKEYL